MKRPIATIIDYDISRYFYINQVEASQAKEEENWAGPITKEKAGPLLADDLEKIGIMLFNTMLHAIHDYKSQSQLIKLETASGEQLAQELTRLYKPTSDQKDATSQAQLHLLINDVVTLIKGGRPRTLLLN